MSLLPRCTIDQATAPKARERRAKKHVRQLTPLQFHLFQVTFCPAVRRQRKIPPQPPPRYSRVFLKWLDPALELRYRATDEFYPPAPTPPWGLVVTRQVPTCRFGTRYTKMRGRVSRTSPCSINEGPETCALVVFGLEVSPPRGSPGRSTLVLGANSFAEDAL